MSFQKWKSFDFGETTTGTESISVQKKCNTIKPKKRVVKSREIPSQLKQISFDFFKEIVPQSTSELVVHSKKLQELEGWLKTVTEQYQYDKKTEFLLLTGPTGSGKSSAIQVLCKSLNIEIAEWINPVDIDFDLLKQDSQISMFIEFFNDAKYCSLFNKEGGRKVIIVKDFPNAFLRNPEEFSEVLEQIAFTATHPVLFICTDSNNEANLQRLLFPDETLIKYSITHMSFNICAPTLLKKSLKRVTGILEAHPNLFEKPSVDLIDLIVNSSMGDIRCAMNQLFLSSLIKNENQLSEESSKQITSKRKRTHSSQAIKNMTRDQVLGLFHGLGKVLNPKRIDQGNSWRLNCDMEKLVDEFSIQPSKFTSFLYENYLKYFGNLNDVKNASEILSFSTRLLDNWENHHVLVMALWIAVLGVMVTNEHRVSKWNQIRGPKKICNKQLSMDQASRLHATDRYYYYLITKSNDHHQFNCNF
ncbi:hypothetical protein ABEB36_008384 [Hypothenemus hampei]|uniref:Cell cycle checkpoint protein RAD17 n=1 Tax=Hypothenemus hampei TaxID=57062 RepID=A0ABD1EQQ4_HYPHA